MLIRVVSFLLEVQVTDFSVQVSKDGSSMMAADLTQVTMGEIARNTFKQVSETMFPGKYFKLLAMILHLLNNVVALVR